MLAGKQRFDNSTIKSVYQQCERKTLYRYVLHLIKAEEELTPATYGSALSLAFDEFFLGHGEERAFKQFKTLVDRDIDEKRTLLMAEKIIGEYYKRYAHTRSEIEVISIEKPYLVDFGEFEFWCKIDKVVKWLYGITAIDHKTTSTRLPQWVKQLDNLHQFSGYIHALHKTFGKENVYGIMADLIGIPGVYKAKESIPDFDRVHVLRSEAQIEAWKSWVRGGVASYQRCMELGEWNKFDDYCDSWNRECEYKLLCEFPSNDPHALDEYAMNTSIYVKKPWEPWTEVGEPERLTI